MTTELKQAAQQAVDAFDAFGDADDFASLLELTRKVRALHTAIQQAEAQQPATGEPVAWSEREQLRHAQAAVVMPMIGPLLDAWENSDREVMSQELELSKQLKNINSAMEDADTHQAPSVPMTGEQWTDVLGSAGPDMLDLAKQWADNKIHVYQVINEAEKIVKAAVLRGITAQAKKEAPCSQPSNA